MTSYSALAPVSAAVYAALNVAGMTALATGGVYDVLPQNTTYPAVLFEVSEPRQMGGFGTKPGTKHFPEIEVRVHAFSQQPKLSDTMAIIDKAAELLKDPPTVSGYSSWAIFHDATLNLGDQIVSNVVVHEIVAIFRLYVEAP